MRITPRMFLSQIFMLSRLFIKEQLNEPVAFFWIMISPCAIFYMMIFSKNDSTVFETEYLHSAAWFFAYVASSVALFGFCFYIIGRRESGFVRSFIYTPYSRRRFLVSHFFSYSLISILYCSLFYLSSRPLFGAYNITEYLDILTRFYLCFILFCIPGLILTLAALNFQNANTIISIFSFSMIAIGIIGSVRREKWVNLINIWNPIDIAKNIMLGDMRLELIWAILLGFLITLIACHYLFRINPVWGRP
ncbi:ABC transporter permease [Pseudomonas syringae]|uniref:ABC transporter permease n=1 Tax=Pseudomonas syringae TaxID=317 RepID=UPI000C1C91DC